MTKYWETEKPITVTTACNVIMYYPKAGKLAVSRPQWEDGDGVSRQGKTVAFDVSALMESGKDNLLTAQKVFIAVLASIENRLSVL